MHEDFRRPTGGGQGVQILFTFRLYDAGEFYAAISSIKVVFYDQGLLSFCVCRHVHKIVKSDCYHLCIHLPCPSVRPSVHLRGTNRLSPDGFS
jgi:hypothetical protein